MDRPFGKVEVWYRIKGWEDAELAGEINFPYDGVVQVVQRMAEEKILSSMDIMVKLPRENEWDDE